MWRINALLGLSLLAGAGWAADPEKQPVQVEADRLEIDEQRDLSVYQGNVVIIQGDLRLQADRVEVRGAQGKAELLTATGKPVRFQTKPGKGGKPVNGEAERLEYVLNADVITLSDNARVTQGADVFSSERIQYDRKRSQIKAGAAVGGKRIRMLIAPKDQGAVSPTP